MPAFSQGLEKALHQALTFANERHHEDAALQHGRMALMGRSVAAPVSRGSYRKPDDLKGTVRSCSDTEVDDHATGDDGESTPSAGFQWVVHPAVIHVQACGRDGVSGAG